MLQADVWAWHSDDKQPRIIGAFTRGDPVSNGRPIGPDLT